MAGQNPQTQPQYAPPQMPAKPGGGSSVLLIILAVVGAILVLTVLMCAILAALLLPAVGAARYAAREQQSKNNLKQIGLGIHNYHDTFKVLPRAAMPDEKGVPRHSWRSAILPFTEQLRIYDQLDQGKAWNQPPNSQFNGQAMPFLHSPNDEESPDAHTSYLAIVGPEAAFDPSRHLSLRDIKNGTSNVIAVIEVRNNGIGWMEPRDISIEDAVKYINSSERPVNALMMDGSVQPIDPNVPPDELRKLMTRESNPGNRL